MIKVICDRCDKRGERKIIVPMSISPFKDVQNCETFKGDAIVTFDLCENCYLEYLDLIREFMKFNKKDEFAF